MAACHKLGYKYFEDGDFNVNIVGIRNSTVGNVVTNSFDDHLTISYKDGGVVTTDGELQGLFQASIPEAT